MNFCSYRKKKKCIFMKKTQTLKYPGLLTIVIKLQKYFSRCSWIKSLTTQTILILHRRKHMASAHLTPENPLGTRAVLWKICPRKSHHIFPYQGFTHILILTLRIVNYSYLHAGHENTTDSARKTWLLLHVIKFS